jgi:uncharacterized membrane protein YhhN
MASMSGPEHGIASRSAGQDVLGFWPRGDAAAQILLALSAMLAFAYGLQVAGLEAPYPFSVALKSAGIILLGLLALQRKQIFLAAGIFAGSAGDAFLALQPSQASNLFFGMAAFAIGHLIYVVIFSRRLAANGFRKGRIGVFTAIAAALIGGVLLILLLPGMGELAPAGIVYTLVIILMTAMAGLAGTPKLALFGAISFLISDSILAYLLFGDALTRLSDDQLLWAGAAVWLSYYLGQAGIALGLSKAS